MKKNIIIIIFIAILFIGGIALFIFPQSSEENYNPSNDSDVSTPTPETVNFIIHIDSEASDSEIETLKKDISNLNITIDDMTFKNKEEVRQEIIANGGSEGEAAKNYTSENNPYDHQLLLRVLNVEDKDSLKKKIEIFINVTEVEY